MTSQVWGRRSQLVLFGGWALGLLVVLLGWWGTSGEATSDDQFRWIGLGVAGMILCLGVSAAWVFTGMRAVGARIAAVVPRPSEVARPVVEIRAVSGTGADDVLVAAAGMRYYHRASCRLAQGKGARAEERTTHLREGRAACGVCQPDQPVGVSAA